jgi:hypothetical protein
MKRRHETVDDMLKAHSIEEISMKTISISTKTIPERLNRQATCVVASFVLLAICLLRPAEVKAQWTTPDANNNINSTNTGNVGVGTTAPDSKLTVSTNTTATAAPNASTLAHFVGANGSTARILIDALGVNPASIDLRRANNTASSPTALLTNSLIGQITWQGYGATAYGSGSRIKIMGYAAENWSDTAQGTHLTFHTTPIGGTATAEVMRLDSRGYLGVGTTAPTYKLDVQGGRINSSDGLCIAGDCKTAWSQVGGSQWGTSGSNIYFNTGNVGVGTTSPQARLDVPIADVNTSLGGSTGQYALRLGNIDQTVNNFSVINFDDTAGNTAPSALFGVQFVDHANNYGSFVFGTRSASGFSEKMRIQSAGNVGVGTASPAAKLDIAGGGDNDGTGDQYDIALQYRLGGYRHRISSRHNAGAQAGNAIDFYVWSQGVNALTDIGTRHVMTLDGNGNVGIGTKTPATAKLVISGASGAPGLDLASTDQYAELRVVRNSLGSLDKDLYLQFQAGAGSNLHLYSNNTETLTLAGGNVSAPGNLSVVGTITGGNIVAKYQDVAEWVPSTQKLAAGTVVVLDTERTNHVVASAAAYDTKVAGVVSTRPGIALGEGGEGRLLVATTGRVRVKVDATRSAIHVGDLLVTSEMEGVAMKSEPVLIGGRSMHAPGTILGKALEPLPGGVGEILVLLSLQ